MPMARKNTGLAEAMVEALPPSRPPTITGARVAPSELNEPPNCTNWLPWLGFLPSELSMGLTTVLSRHIEKPATKAPIR